MDRDLHDERFIDRAIGHSNQNDARNFDRKLKHTAVVAKHERPTSQTQDRVAPDGRTVYELRDQSYRLNDLETRMLADIGAFRSIEKADLLVATLWDAAREAGFTTASVNWPVSVGANVNYLIPEVWRANTPDDRKLMRALSTPGMLALLENELGPYAEPLGEDLASDRQRAKFAIAILRKYKPQFMTVHLTSLDHIEHETGPFSAEANALLEGIDELVGLLREALLAADPDAVICVVSDHGFSRVIHRLNLIAAFVQHGLIELTSTADQPGVQKIKSWRAAPWISGGSVAIVLKDPNDEGLRKKTAMLLEQLAADPANGINRIVGREELTRLGGNPKAAFFVDLKLDFQAENDLTKPLHRDTKLGGTHGYLPEHPELRASFFISGRAIAKGQDLGVIDMRQIAPTLAGLLGVSLSAADAKPVALAHPGTKTGTGEVSH